MTTLKSNEEAQKLIKNGVLEVDDDLEIAFDGFNIDADIKCKNIYSKDYRRNITCRNITCVSIDCWNIYSWNITCVSIDCVNITCENINCWNINYYAFVIAYYSFKCKSAKGRRYNSFHKCLDKEIEYKEEETVNIKISKKSLEALKESGIKIIN